VWRGFIDIGILTDPAYRGQGLGKAAVSICAAHYLPGDKIVGYRHDIRNLGSRGIALSLGFSPYAQVDTVRPPAK
jgi:RimJ/RimL family protein N-acetyltransferase